MSSFYFVKTDIHRRNFSVNDGKLWTNRLPRESMNWFFNFHTIDWDLFFSHVENFKIVWHSLKRLNIEYTIKIWNIEHLNLKSNNYSNTDCIFLFGFLFSFGKPVDLDAKIISRLLPVDLAVGDVEQIFVTSFIATEKKRRNYDIKNISLFVW